MRLTIYIEPLQNTKQQCRINGVECSAQVLLNEQCALTFDKFDKFVENFAQCSFNRVTLFIC